MNIQFAVKDGEVYVLEVNPRASRTVPFVSKATGLNLAQVAARVMVGRSLENQGVTTEPIPRYVSVKEAVFPFAKFPGVDIVLGPEMRSTGEVMGIDTDFASAFAKSQLAALSRLPSHGTVFVSVAERDRQAVVPISRRLSTMGFRLIGTSGTVGTLLQHGIDITTIRKIREGRPNLLDHLANGTIDLIVNTPSGKGRGPTRAASAPVPSATACPASRPSPAPGPPLRPWNGSEKESSMSMRFKTYCQTEVLDRRHRPCQNARRISVSRRMRNFGKNREIVKILRRKYAPTIGEFLSFEEKSFPYVSR